MKGKLKLLLQVYYFYMLIPEKVVSPLEYVQYSFELNYLEVVNVRGLI
jgi:hypothetical protein